MPDLSTTYMGLALKNPLIMGASKLTADIPAMLEAEKAGAAAVVCTSLFEEQIRLERYRLDLDLDALRDGDEEAQNLFAPEDIHHAGADQHLMWVRKTKEALNIPVIASLNAVTREAWIAYARALENCGVDGLEINFYYNPRDMEKTGEEVESEQIDILRDIKRTVDIPVAIKLSHFYSNPLNVIKRMDEAGADAFVLFNRLFASDIDIERELHTKPFNFSSEGDNKMPTRFIGLLTGHLEASLCSNTGILTARDAIKTLLAGANAFQVVTALYLNKIPSIRTFLDEIEAWMTKRGYENLADFRGKLSAKEISDKFIYQRAQYVDMILNSEKLMKP